jgi:hypothetical protein
MSDKYQPPAAGLLENYKSDLSVEADGDTDPEVSGDVAKHQEASNTAKPGR